MRTVIITGSTRGIGYGLASEFLARGHAVVINGRTAHSVEAATTALREQHSSDRIASCPGDVSQYATHQALWDCASGRFGTVDIWINNAGLGNLYKSAWEQDPALMRSIINVNLLGAMNGTHLAYNRMLQQGGGEIYNMEGFGSDGRKRDGLAIYGSSKYGLHYFTEAFTAEAGAESPVLIGSLSPGMVVTDLLTDAFEDPQELERSKRIFNILANRPETVTPWLVERMLANDEQGAAIRWLTTPKIIWRFLRAPFTSRDLFN